MRPQSEFRSAAVLRSADWPSKPAVFFKFLQRIKCIMQDTIKTKGFDIIIYGTNIEKYAIIKMFWKNIFAGTDGCIDRLQSRRTV